MPTIAAFFDWDGTLSVDGVHLPPENRTALEQLQQAGHRVFLCTGRAPGFIPMEARTFPFDGMVAAAGGYVRLGETQLIRRVIDPDVVSRTISYFLGTGQSCVLEGEQCNFVVNDKGYEWTDWPRLRSAANFFHFFPGQAISKLTVRGQLDSETTAFLSPLYTLIIHDTYVEALPIGAGKATGMRRILEELHLPQDNCWGFGDSFNDLDMLRYAGVGVVMGNAPETVQAAGDLITDTADHAGVAKAIQYLLSPAGQQPIQKGTRIL